MRWLPGPRTPLVELTALPETPSWTNEEEGKGKRRGGNQRKEEGRKEMDSWLVGVLRHFQHR